MFSKDEILKQLRAGADAQDIAQKMADEINAAVKTYDEEQEAIKQAEAKAKALENEKRKDARDLIDNMADFFTKYFGEDGEDLLPEEDREEAVDAILELMDHIIGLKSVLDIAAAKPARKPTGCQCPTCDDEIDDIALKNFLKSLR
jgi:methylase of polypeptide subunit release factors